MSSSAELQSIYSDLHALRGASSLMNWDRQVLMPRSGAEARSAHTAILARMAHELLTSDRTRRLVQQAKPETDEELATIRVLKRELKTTGCLPAEFVTRFTKVSNDAYENWKQAKAESNFKLLEPFLTELVDMSREKAELLGYANDPYDALIDLFEEGATRADAEAVFKRLGPAVKALVMEIKGRGREIDDSALRGDWDPQRLRNVAQTLAAQIGFDFDQGRLDVAFNAFCGGASRSDIRMTTRPSNHIKGIISSSLHEMGHGLYEQNSPPEWDGTPIAGGISLAVHESQSRTWENVVGRSLAFWTHFLPVLQAEFPQLASLDPAQMFRAMNKVQAEPMRVGADELTYNLHIQVRFELETALISGKLAVKDLPAAWNAKYEEHLGLTPESDSVGVLQDVHWTRGTFGYFPTYTFGNLIGLQIWDCLQRDLGDTEAMFLTGNFKPVLDWLREKVYSKGKLYPPKDLITQVTGKPMTPDAWLTYADKKYRAIYGL